GGGQKYEVQSPVCGIPGDDRRFFFCYRHRHRDNRGVQQQADLRTQQSQQSGYFQDLIRSSLDRNVLSGGFRRASPFQKTYQEGCKHKEDTLGNFLIQCMLNRSYILTLLLYLLVSYRQVFSQCSPRKVIWDDLKRIEENTTA